MRGGEKEWGSGGKGQVGVSWRSVVWRMTCSNRFFVRCGVFRRYVCLLVQKVVEWRLRLCT